LAVLALPLFLGMGTGMLGEEQGLVVPEPDQSFTAVVVDQDDMSTEVSDFTCDGWTYFLGTRGKTEFSVGFERIESARFFWEPPKVRGDFALKDGQNLSLMLEPETPCLGKSRYGAVRVKVRDLKTLTLSGPNP